MLFNSISFLIFFLVVIPVYFFLPNKFRWIWLLLTSCYFYMAFIPQYILVLFFLIVLDFFLGITIEKSVGEKREKWLILSIFSNVGTLFLFKYFNFFEENIRFLFQFFNVSLSSNAISWVLPLGLSFHTFQSLSYVIEVYRGNVKAEKHLGIYALYVMFFPQLVAGPIERPQHMLKQFYEHHSFESARFFSGLQRMVWGFFKKIVVADRLAVFVNTVYSAPSDAVGPSVVIATLFFAFQIYCDFSGYCDIAIGVAKILGFELSENFRAPYFSRSISEFWHRWHMSLSSWFRDYVYFSLGGSRVTESKVARNLFLTFLLSGLWHGASWTYVFWGAINGVYLIVERLLKKVFPSKNFFHVGATFVLICFSWIFFRAKNLSDAFTLIKQLGTGWFNINSPLFIQKHIFFDRVDTSLYVALFSLCILILGDLYLNFSNTFFHKISSSKFVQLTTSFVLFFLILVLWEGKGSEFIYFQF